VLVELTTRALTVAGAAPGLTLVQWRALVLVSSSPGLRASEAADRLGMARPSMSRLVGRLERLGLIVAEVDPSDGRATTLRATREGHELKDRVLATRLQLLETALHSLTGGLPEDLVGALTAIRGAVSNA